MQDKIIDIHCHILPGIDDGSKSWDESINMVRQAVGQGIEAIIATPHFIPSELEIDKEIVFDNVSVLQNKIDDEGLDCTIYSGMELYLDPQLIKHFDEGNIISLAGSQYVLVEFPANEVSANLINLLHEIRIRGYHPIVAHPERNLAILEEPFLLNELLDYKTLFQINAASIIGREGTKIQKFAKDLIKQGLVSFIGSDAHSSNRRSFKTREAISSLERFVDASLMKKMISQNGRNILSNVEIKNDEMYRVNESIVKQLVGFFDFKRRFG